MIKDFKYEYQGQSYILSELDRKKIKAQLTLGGPVDTNGLTLYPIYSEPSEQDLATNHNLRQPATVIRDRSPECMRWYWQVTEHSKKHTACKLLGDGLCGQKVVRFANWNREESKWELEPMVNPATPEQLKVLDKI